jgi:hypothetical protein
MVDFISSAGDQSLADSIHYPGCDVYRFCMLYCILRKNWKLAIASDTRKGRL